MRIRAKAAKFPEASTSGYLNVGARRFFQSADGKAFCSFTVKATFSGVQALFLTYSVSMTEARASSRHETVDAPSRSIASPRLHHALSLNHDLASERESNWDTTFANALESEAVVEEEAEDVRGVSRTTRPD